MKYLPFRSNGHLFTAADGELVTVAGSLPVPLVIELTSARCAFCDRYSDAVITEDAVTERTPCPYPDGFTSVITLAVPSGTIIVSDDLRPVYNWSETGLTSYNSLLGQHQVIAAMAKAGCAYGPVGNSCPGLYRTGTDTYVIASPGYDPESDQEILPADWTRLAGIITDLWAYSIADFADWKARGGNPAALQLGWSETVVDVTPGTYEFTHHTGERTFNDTAGTIIFADIRRLAKESS